MVVVSKPHMRRTKFTYPDHGRVDNDGKRSENQAQKVGFCVRPTEYCKFLHKCLLCLHQRWFWYIFVMSMADVCRLLSSVWVGSSGEAIWLRRACHWVSGRKKKTDSIPTTVNGRWMRNKYLQPRPSAITPPRIETRDIMQVQVITSRPVRRDRWWTKNLLFSQSAL